MASVTGRVIQSLRVVGDSLIPDKDGASLIPHSTLEVLALRDVIEEEAKKVV